MADVSLAGQISVSGKAKQGTPKLTEAQAAQSAAALPNETPKAFVLVDGERVPYDPYEPYGQEKAVAAFLTEHKGTRPTEYLTEKCKTCGVSPIRRQGGGAGNVSCSMCNKLIEVAA